MNHSLQILCCKFNENYQKVKTPAEASSIEDFLATVLLLQWCFFLSWVKMSAGKDTILASKIIAGKFTSKIDSVKIRVGIEYFFCDSFLSLVPVTVFFICVFVSDSWSITRVID